jgi:hypothetical protein
MRIKPPSRHLKSLCRQLGPEYKITVIDLEYVINRDFGNGYDIEVSGVNTSRMNASATIYLWKDKRRIIKIIDGVRQQDIAKWSEWLREKSQSITPEDYDSDGFLKEPRRVHAEVTACPTSR